MQMVGTEGRRRSERGELVEATASQEGHECVCFAVTADGLISHFRFENLELSELHLKHLHLVLFPRLE
jgi:hypothetical protein